MSVNSNIPDKSQFSQHKSNKQQVTRAGNLKARSDKSAHFFIKYAYVVRTVNNDNFQDLQTGCNCASLEFGCVWIVNFVRSIMQPLRL